MLLTSTENLKIYKRHEHGSHEVVTIFMSKELVPKCLYVHQTTGMAEPMYHIELNFDVAIRSRDLNLMKAVLEVLTQPDFKGKDIKKLIPNEFI